MSQPGESRLLPLLPLRDIVVFPHMMVPLYVGRARSIAAVEEAMKGNRELLLAAQKKAKTNEPASEDIYTVGTVGQIMQHIKRPDGTVKVLVEGRRRIRIERFVPNDSFFLVEATELPEEPDVGVELEALLRTVQDAFESYARLSKKLQPDVLESIKSIELPGRLADTIVAHLPIKHSDKQAMLEMQDPKERLDKLFELMQAEVEIMQVERKIRTRVKKQMERTEKEYYLNEQMRAIQKELGERDEFKSEIQEIEDLLKEKELPQEAQDRVVKEIKKLKMMSPMSAEATVVRNYIDWCLSLPWSDLKEEKLELDNAEAVLDEDHYGLKKPKERILEYLAVHKLVDKMKGPILCLVGPPGVGKTSLARSIARATGRDFVRQSLGGVRDEAEIRGHRRTYIGALPGKIIQSLKKAGSNNPVFLLDEIDKMSMDFRGDPSAALLEVLDPEQNDTFTDHYLDLDYDLSNVMFICTANTLQGVPGPLEDRLEIIRIAGYTEQEKMAIAKRYLIPKQRLANGIADYEVQWSEGATRSIVNHYTREAGVRSLEREIGSVCRKIAREVVKEEARIFKTSADDVPSAEATDEAPSTAAMDDAPSTAAMDDAPSTAAMDDVPSTAATDDAPAVSADTESGAESQSTPAKSDKDGDKAAAKTIDKIWRVTPAKVKSYLGVEKFRHNKREEESEVGMATGLAWTQMGGEILQIEVSTMPGKGKLTITGKLGDVMQESAQAAMSYVRARAHAWGLNPKFYENIDLHIHVPEGAMPKDGPSAGITMATALVSALTKIPVRNNVAMTGEITLRGRVLPIGGLKEKALAAHRAEIKTIILPSQNEKDLEEIPKTIAKQLTFRPVEHLDEVLRYALELDDVDDFFAKARAKADSQPSDGDGKKHSGGGRSMSGAESAGSSSKPH